MNQTNNRCKCGIVQFKYNGDCLSCGLTEEERQIITDNPEQTNNRK